MSIVNNKIVLMEMYRHASLVDSAELLTKKTADQKLFGGGAAWMMYLIKQGPIRTIMLIVETALRFGDQKSNVSLYFAKLTLNCILSFNPLVRTKKLN